MPVRKVKGGWQWGHHGKVYRNRKGAERQAAAAYASGYKESASLGQLMVSLRYLAEGRQISWKTSELPIKDLLKSFKIDFDKKNDKKHDYLVKRLKDGNEFPPIMVLHSGKGYVILDGHHRIAACNTVGRKSIKAVVGETDE